MQVHKILLIINVQIIDLEGIVFWVLLSKYKILMLKWVDQVVKKCILLCLSTLWKITILYCC